MRARRWLKIESSSRLPCLHLQFAALVVNALLQIIELERRRGKEIEERKREDRFELSSFGWQKTFGWQSFFAFPPYLVLLEAGSQLQIPLVLVQLVDAVVVLLAQGNQSGCLGNGIDKELISCTNISPYPHWHRQWTWACPCAG